MEASKLRPGAVFKMEGKTWQVLEYEYVQNDRRKFIRVKIKDLASGVAHEQRFNGTEYFEDAQITNRNMQFSYNVDNIYTFMDPNTFDQMDVNFDLVKNAMQYHTEGNIYVFTMLEDKVINVTPPTFVVMAVTNTERSVAGDTARNAMKNATLESGLVIKVPMFVNNGDKLRIDTRDGTYVERA
jgi:elongation factor P